MAGRLQQRREELELRRAELEFDAFEQELADRYALRRFEQRERGVLLALHVAVQIVLLLATLAATALTVLCVAGGCDWPVPSLIGGTGTVSILALVKVASGAAPAGAEIAVRPHSRQGAR